MILAGTGHRVLWGAYYPHKSWNPICQMVIDVLEKEKPKLIISGGALGFDSLLMDAALFLQIPYLLAAPFPGQDDIWNLKSRARYKEYLRQAERVDIVSNGSFSPRKMQIRNEYMVDRSDVLLALLDPEVSKGGTQNCFNYAHEKGKRIIHLNPREIQ